MLRVYQDRVVQATSPGGFGCSLSLSSSGALALPEIWEVYDLKMLVQFFRIILLVFGPAVQPEAASTGFQHW